MTEPEEDSKLARLRALAEEEMRRTLPGSRPAKRRKKGGGGGSGDADGGAPAAAEGAGAALGGRFDYGAVKDLETGLQGFVLTCPLQRENSARKESLPLLQRYLQRGSRASEPAEAAPGAPTATGSSEHDGAIERSAAAAAAAAAAPPAQPRLAAIKVACRGVVAFRLLAANAPSTNASARGTAEDGSLRTEAAAADAAGPSSADGDQGGDGVGDGATGTAGCHPSSAWPELVLSAATALLSDIDGGSQPRTSHVQRLVPVQTTCRVERLALEQAGGRLAALVAAAHGAAAKGATGVEEEAEQSSKVTFGIAVKQRALEGAGGKPQDGAAGGASGEGQPATTACSTAAAGSTQLDRSGIISALAGGFESALRQRHGLEAGVDLKAPSWVLVVEVLPAAGALYAALCALPAALCVVKPKLHIRAVGKA